MIKTEKISETEYRLGENNITLFQDDIIYVIPKGEQSYEMALAYKKICEILYSTVEGKINYLINLNECGKNELGAREIWKELTQQKKTRKVATFGLNPVARVIASFVIGMYKGNNLLFFKTKEDAIKWISE